MSGKVSGTEPRGNSGGSPSCAAHIYGRCDGSPEEDRSLPLKYVTKFEYGDALAQDVRGEGTTPVFGSNGVVGSHDVANTLAPSIIIGRKGSFGKVTWADMPAFCIDTAYYIDKRHTKANLRWLYWMLQTLGLDMFSEDTGVPGLSREKAYRVHVPYPPLPEQTRIANFLDEQTARIDALIAEKERLDALLGEYRGSLISAAVTGQLDPTTGEAPRRAHERGGGVKAEPRALGACWAPASDPRWTVRRVKDIATIINGYPFDASLFDADGTYPLVRIRDLDSETTETRYSGEWVETAAIDTGDVLIGMDGDFNIGVWKGAQALLNQRMCCVRAEPLMQRFLSYVLPTPLKVANDLTYSTTVKHLSSLDVERITFAMPPEHMLEPILNFLDEQTARIDDLRNHCREHVALLREYRSSLISAAVTGQLDMDGSKSCLS